MSFNYENYVLHNELLDTEHRAIVTALMNLKINSKNQTEKLIAIRNQLEQHFINEGQLMEESNYPLADLHKVAHSEYLHQFALVEDVSSDFTLSDCIAATLNHINWHDRLFVEYYKSINT